ncbi:MAG: hypothetical protein ACTTH8_03815 [Treponema sp.]
MIAFAHKDGDYVEAYDENGNRLWCTHVESGAQILGNTVATVSVKMGSYVEVYDENGDRISCTHVGS